MERRYFIGLMSGTSIDSVDVVLGDFSQHPPQQLASLDYPIPPDLKQASEVLCTPGDNEIDTMGHLDRQLGKLYAEAVLALLKAQHVAPAYITAIGSHGQTIRHRPPNGKQNPDGFSLQIGDPNTIAFETGITTIADFRRMDIAAGGQGAPLAPLFHQHFFQSSEEPRTVVNIGGMANITTLHPAEKPTGFDTGPGNILLDSWIQRCKNQPFDHNGSWAHSGNVHEPLLKTMLQHPFFAIQGPKSTGREAFNSDWLQQQIAPYTLAEEDIQATLAELTAQSIASAIHDLSETYNACYVCGGGAFNSDLLERLQRHLGGIAVATTKSLGVAPEWVEAMGFAWLAQQRLDSLTLDTPAVTGAGKPVIAGAVYQV